MRDHVDSIKELVEQFPDHGYRRIRQELAKKLKVNLSDKHMFVIQRIMQEVAEERVAVGVPDLVGYDDFEGDLHDHVDAIKDLMSVHPGQSCAYLGRELARVLR
eukprot:2076261-Pyramimonas_sp.AAC.1